MNRIIHHIRIIVSLVVLMLSSMHLSATHVVGGELFYKWNADGDLEVYLEVLRDCENGLPTAPFDSIAWVGVYQWNQGRTSPRLSFNFGLMPNVIGREGAFGLLLDTIVRVPGSNQCFIDARESCVDIGIYKVTLPVGSAMNMPWRMPDPDPSFDGYLFAYGRCCRNQLIENISGQPTQTGMIVRTEMSREAWAEQNNQPDWEYMPPLYICEYQDTVLDFSAQDPEGNRLEFSLFNPYIVGDSLNNFFEVGPDPQELNEQVRWRSGAGFGLNSLFGANSSTSIDPNTGLLSITSEYAGTFLIGIKLCEYDSDDNLISCRTQEFQVTVRVCSETKAEAEFTFDEDPCNTDYEVQFFNKSIGGNNFRWFFEYPDSSITSDEENPIHIYPPRIGTYTVLLYVEDSLGCSDTFIDTVFVFNSEFEPKFTAEGSCGAPSYVILCDSTTGTFPIVYRKWKIEIGDRVYEDSTGNAKDSILVDTSGTAIITLHVIDSVGCDSMLVDTVDIDFVLADFEIDKDSCDNGLTVPFINTSSGASGYTWYFNYPDLSDSSNQENPVFTYPSRGRYDVMLIARGDSLCNDTIIKTVVLRDPQLFPDFTAMATCDEEPLLMLMDTSSSFYGIVSYDWTVDISGRNYTASGRKVNIQLDTTGLAIINLKITDSIGCMAEKSDTLDLRLLEADFEIDRDSCDNGFEVPFLNRSTGATNYTWYFNYPSTADSSNEENPVFTYPDVGRYQVMLIARRDSICFDTVIKEVVILDPQLMPAFEASSTCLDSLVLTLIDSSKSRYPIVSWDWSINLNNNFYSANGKEVDIRLDEEGTAIITLKITDSVGCMAMVMDTVELNFIDIRLISDTITICQGDSTRLVENGDSTLVYEWKPETGLNLEKPWDPWAKPDTTTLYTLCVSDSVCTVILDVLVIVEPVQQVEIEGDTSSCDGKFTLVAVSPDSDKFEWSDNPDFTNIIGTGDTLMVMVTDSQKVYVRTGMDGDCRGIDSTTLYNRAICLDYQNEFNLCVDEMIMINLVNCKPEQDLFVRWDDNDIIISSTDSLSIKIMPRDTGRYILNFMVANLFGCILQDSIIVNVSQKPQNIDFEALAECDNPVVKFTATGDPAENYFWDFGDGNTASGGPMIEHTYENKGLYTVVLTAGNNGCDTTITKDVTVVFFECPEEDVKVLCEGGMVELNPNGNPDCVYTWSPGEFLDDSTAVNPKATVDESVRFRVILMDSVLLPGCKDTCFVDVAVPPTIDIDIEGDSLLCNEDSTTLTAVISNPNAEVSWCDEDGNVIDTTTSITIFPELGQTCYTFKAIDNLGCSSSKTVCVVRCLLDFDIMATDTICEGDTAIVMITNMDLDTLVLNGDTLAPGEKVTFEYTPDSTTTYEYELLNDCCMDTISVTITVNEIDVVATADPWILPRGCPTQLNATFNPNWTYEWTPDDGTLSETDIHDPTATPNDSTIYMVKVTDANGCMATDTVEVRVIPAECNDQYVFLPNAFSPNDDGVNDILFVRSLIVDDMELIIYNRWGQEVFRSQSQSQGWDGTYNGTKLMPDVFSYYLWVRCKGQEEFVDRGNITLLK